jgi:hypothetical protein
MPCRSKAQRFATRRIVAGLVLLGLLMLVGRPIAMRSFSVGPAPEDMAIVGLSDGGHVCVINSSCDAVTPATFGLTAVTYPVLLMLTYIPLLVVTDIRRDRDRAALRRVTPPPRGTV